MPSLSDTLEVFVPMRPVNPLNRREHHFARWKRSQKERELLAMALWATLRADGTTVTATPESPKHVTFTVHCARLFDEGDNLAAVCKHLRDELIPLGLIHSDGPDSGHVFEYAQVVQQPLGVQLTVRRA